MKITEEEMTMEYLRGRIDGYEGLTVHDKEIIKALLELAHQTGRVEATGEILDGLKENENQSN